MLLQFVIQYCFKSRLFFARGEIALCHLVVNELTSVMDYTLGKQVAAIPWQIMYEHRRMWVFYRAQIKLTRMNITPLGTDTHLEKNM